MNVRAALPLSNPIQRYPWGSRTAIATLLGAPPALEPEAELWMGAHPRAPSSVPAPEGPVALDVWIAKNPTAVLGREVADRFENRLPFLFKVLAADQPLSIQTHPDAAMARAGFERENLAGIPLDAPERCYVDPNPKPELICALTPFRALNRFRALEEIAELFGDVGAPELRSAIETMRSNGKDGVRRLLRTLLMLDTPARRAVLDTGARWARGASGEPAAECLLELSDRYPNDIGALAPLLLNLVELQPGEAMFLPPGELHAYLSGTGLELMANSDNVLRGGLTSKHVDEEALLDVLQYRMGPVERLHPRPVRSGESIYETPAEQFALSVIDTNALLAFESTDDHGVEILLCTSGECDLTCLGQRAVRLTRGASVFVPASAPRYAITGRAVVYRAHVPHD